MLVISIFLFHIALLMSKHHSYRSFSCPFLRGNIFIIPLSLDPKSSSSSSDIIINSKSRYNLIKVLEFTAKFENGAKVEDISTALNLSRKVVRTHLNKLEKFGLVSCFEDKYKITDEGKRTLNKIRLSGF
ncbi:winged helix-turn-helix domain-containing protein [Sulfolobus tengchongensis]|uniref:Winged helix-turn-helix domain-containing protein n=1 Tax=Sulfolobus tengchongensis TaxID=207809 RepID=A0AAX4KXW2_9CREN